MQFSTNIHPKSQYSRLGPLFYDKDIIGIVEGDVVLGSVARSTVTAIRFEQRSSFKHPYYGFALGAILVGISLEVLIGDPLGIWWLTLGSCAGVGSMLFFGSYLLVAVLRRRDEPWVVFVLKSSERAFPLKQPLLHETAELASKLCNSAPLLKPPAKCAVCGYDLRATPDRCPECGTHAN